jgi:5-methylthioadenosine/S-adenosylhomocysteine deaminase
VLLRMITIDAAHALGMADRVGSLEHGKDADFCVVALDRAHVAPVADPLTAVFHAARGSDVIATAIAGTLVYADGVVSTLDELDLKPRVDAIAARLHAARQS